MQISRTRRLTAAFTLALLLLGTLLVSCSKPCRLIIVNARPRPVVLTTDLGGELSLAPCEQGEYKVPYTLRENESFDINIDDGGKISMQSVDRSTWKTSRYDDYLIVVVH